MKEHYQSALRELLEAGHDPATVFAGLRRTLAQRHHSKLLPRVLRGLLRELMHDTRAVVAASVARRSDIEALKADITAAAKTLAKKEPELYVVDDTLIGGYNVEAAGKRIDATYKTKLLTLYHQITT